LIPPEIDAALPRQPRDESGPVFAEAWQAQAFALALQLQRSGHFTAAEWADTLGAVLREAGDDDGSHYYEHWLRALEVLSLAKGLTDAATLDVRAEAWADAYRRTPHGRPVELHGP
jgi:nitrile hydratase accessory protein